MALNNVRNESVITTAIAASSTATSPTTSQTEDPTSPLKCLIFTAMDDKSKISPVVISSIQQHNIDEIKMELSTDLIKKEEELDIKTEIATEDFEAAIESPEEGVNFIDTVEPLETKDVIKDTSTSTGTIDIEYIQVQENDIKLENDEKPIRINAGENDFVKEYEGSISESGGDDYFLDEVSSPEMEHSEMSLLKPLDENIQLKTNRKDQIEGSRSSRRDGKIRPTLPAKAKRKLQGVRSTSSGARGKVRKTLSAKPRFLCDKCNREFTTKHNLNRHLITHGGLKPYKCKVCLKEFTQNATLKQHMLLHAGLKPYECEVCSKAFAQNGTLKQHMLIHTGEKPYVCEFCNRAFNQSKSLAFHLRRHTGEKPFHCEFCKLDFRLKDGLKNHIFRYHMEDSIGNKFLCIICKKVMNKKTDLQLHMKNHVNNHRFVNSEAVENGEPNAEVILELINENDEC